MPSPYIGSDQHQKLGAPDPGVRMILPKVLWQLTKLDLCKHTNGFISQKDHEKILKGVHRDLVFPGWTA